MPAFEVPRAAPAAPASLAASVLSSSSLQFAWEPSSVRGDRVRSYLLETFTATPRTSIASGSVFGVAEVQTLTTAGAPGGTFTLAFGNVDAPLPGTVGVVHGGLFLKTSVDLTAHVRRGDRIRVGDATDATVYLVHAYSAFNATHLPLAAYAESALPYRLGSSDLNVTGSVNGTGDTPRGYQGLTNEAATLYHAPTTGALTYDASHLEVQAALESLPSVSTVHVTRDANGNDPGDGGVEGFVWSITFTGPTVLSQLNADGENGWVAGSVNPGDQPLIVPNGRHLTNTTHSSIEVCTRVRMYSTRQAQAEGEQNTHARSISWMCLRLTLSQRL